MLHLLFDSAIVNFCYFYFNFGVVLIKLLNLLSNVKVNKHCHVTI